MKETIRKGLYPWDNRRRQTRSSALWRLRNSRGDESKQKGHPERSIRTHTGGGGTLQDDGRPVLLVLKEYVIVEETLEVVVNGVVVFLGKYVQAVVVAG